MLKTYISCKLNYMKTAWDFMTVQYQMNMTAIRIYNYGVAVSDASISLFQFRYDIDTIFTKYRDIDIKYVSKMHTFCRLKF